MKTLNEITTTRQLSREEAISLAESRWWEGMPARYLAAFQLVQNRLCMPFTVFHAAVEEALGRGVFTHEFGMSREGLISELAGTTPPPTMEEILNLIPAEKRVIVAVSE